MSTRKRELLRQAVAACLALGLLAGGASHALFAPAPPPATTTTHHASHHSPPGQRAPGHDHQQCCDLCVVHCTSDLGPVRTEAAAPSIFLVGSPVIRGYRVPLLPRVRYRLPQSQAPPALLG